MILQEAQGDGNDRITFDLPFCEQTLYVIGKGEMDLMQASLFEKYIRFVDEKNRIPRSGELVRGIRMVVGLYRQESPTESIELRLSSNSEGSVASPDEPTIYSGRLRCSATASAVRVLPEPCWISVLEQPKFSVLTSSRRAM
jgi:hypothetical protein